MLDEITTMFIEIYDELSLVQHEEDNEDLVEFRDNIEWKIEKLGDKFKELENILSRL